MLDVCKDTFHDAHWAHPLTLAPPQCRNRAWRFQCQGEQRRSLRRDSRLRGAYDTGYKYCFRIFLWSAPETHTQRIDSIRVWKAAIQLSEITSQQLGIRSLYPNDISNSLRTTAWEIIGSRQSARKGADMTRHVKLKWSKRPCVELDN